MTDMIIPGCTCMYFLMHFFSVGPSVPIGKVNVVKDIPTAVKNPSVHQTIADDGKIIKMDCAPSGTMLKRKLKVNSVSYNPGQNY